MTESLQSLLEGPCGLSQSMLESSSLCVSTAMATMEVLHICRQMLREAYNFVVTSTTIWCHFTTAVRSRDAQHGTIYLRPSTLPLTSRFQLHICAACLSAEVCHRNTLKIFFQDADGSKAHSVTNAPKAWSPSCGNRYTRQSLASVSTDSKRKAGQNSTWCSQYCTK